MSGEWVAENYSDDDGNPAGGYVRGVGIDIQWQDGPLLRDGEPKRIPNGAFVEHVILAVLNRLYYYQSTQFKCRENALAITKLEEASHWLNSRTARRVLQGIEGTHEGS